MTLFASLERGVNAGSRHTWELGYMTNNENWPNLAPADVFGIVGVSGGDHPAEVDDSTGQDERSIESIVSGLESMIDDLEQLIANRSDDQFRAAAQDGGWGAVEVLSHLHDWEEITHERVWQILEGEVPELVDYDDSMWAIEHEYGLQDPHQVFAHEAGLRRELVARLRTLEESDWSRRAILSGRGEITLTWLMNSLTRHDAKHMAEIREVLS